MHADAENLGRELSEAARDGKPEDVFRLIRAGAPLNCEHEGYTPIMVALSGGHERCVIQMLNFNAEWGAEAIEGVCASTPSGRNILGTFRPPSFPLETAH